MQEEIKQNKKSKFALSQVNLNTVATCVFVMGLALTTQGFCDDYNDLEAASEKYLGFVFHPAIRRTIFGMGCAWGLFSAYLKGTCTPILFYAGLGAAFNFTPSLVKILSPMQ